MKNLEKVLIVLIKKYDYNTIKDSPEFSKQIEIVDKLVDEKRDEIIK